MSVGYGFDTWCLDTLQPGRFASGAALVVQALYRRLITPRGTLRGGDEEGAYGLDVSGYCGAVGYSTAVYALPGLVQAELLKDDRVGPDLNVAAVITESGNGAGGIEIQLSITGSLADESGDFSLTLAVNDVTVSILGGLPS